MTAVPDWRIAGRSDAELAAAAAAGDRGAFAGIYDRYADRLHDFCVGMVRDHDAAADCVQDVFCTAATRLPQLRQPDKLRPWLYAIARHEALRQIRQRRREQVSDELPEVASGEAGPDTLAARTELAALVTEAVGGLSERDRTVLDLTYRHGLDGPELAEALGVTPKNANTMVERLRDTVERSLGALLVARGARHHPDRCPELGAVLSGWDGQFTILMRKRIARHIEACPTCEADRRRLVNPRALLGGAPMFIPAPHWLRAHTLTQIQLTSTSVGTSAERVDSQGAANNQDHLDDAHSGRTRQLIRRVALFAATLIISLGLTIAWLHHQDTPITATGMNTIVPSTPTPAATFTTNAAPNSPPPAVVTPAPQVAPAAPTQVPTASAPNPPRPPVPPAVVTPAIPVLPTPVAIPAPSFPIHRPPPRWPPPCWPPRLSPPRSRTPDTRIENPNPSTCARTK
jgi:RNA polymerase sigma factor (sigma-70 family)